MTDETGRTRRRFLTGASAAVGASIAGCSNRESGGASRTPTDAGAETTTETATGTTPADDARTVRLAPVGDVKFDAVPETAFTVFPWYADMAFALGHGDSINSLWWASEFDAIAEYFTATLDGVSISWDGLAGEYGPSKERLYELDSDVHFVDPAWVSTLDDWDKSDVDEVGRTVGPWFGNHYSARHLTPPDDWADRYAYYGLWDLFEAVAAVYRERARYEALAGVHDRLVTTIRERLPPEAERPTVGYVQLSTDLDDVYALRLNAPGYYNAHTRPLGAVDAFADVEMAGEFTQVDFEAVLDADPDVLLTLWGMTSTVDFAQLRANLEDHTVGRELSAVRTGRVYTQGTRFQGPILNLFQLEMTAKQLYPDVFGPWPGYADGETYPEFPADERLFDRTAVTDAISGAL